MLPATAISPLSIYRWPQPPVLPARGQPVLLRVATTSVHAAARLELRAALKTLLTAWSGLPTESLPLQETPQGPAWNGDLHGQPLDISLSYALRQGLIGLIRGGRIGVDVMVVKPFAEADEVAKHYLNSAVAPTLRQADKPASVFAAAWTQREARLKCLKQDLCQWSVEQEKIESGCFCQNVFFSKHLMAAVAFTFPHLPRPP